MMEKRDEFLIKIYEQMFNDIDRHHKILWQIIGVLIGSFAFIALAEKDIIPIDVAISIVILLSLWVIAHVYDSNYWYNRNLVIISNIERQFLKQTDLNDIHYYFGEHRDKNAIQTSLKIQLYLAWGIILVFSIYHFFTRIYPGFKLNSEEFTIEWIRVIPYTTLLVFYFILVRWIKKKREKNYLEFLQNSPGIDINTVGINYGDGHPTSEN
jgi:hypothetical protein